MYVSQSCYLTLPPLTSGPPTIPNSTLPSLTSRHLSDHSPPPSPPPPPPNMNSSKPNPSTSASSFHFDFGITSSSSSSVRSLNDQKKSPSPAASSFSHSSSPAPNKPPWTHQSARSTAGFGAGGGLSNPASMVGDIFGKSWAAAPPSSGNTRIGLPESKNNPNLFGDLLGAALGQQHWPTGGAGGSAPLKTTAGAAKGGSFSMGGIADSLPKTAIPTKPASYAVPKVGSFASSGAAAPMNKMGGAPMKAESSSSASMASSKGGDPFASLSNFGFFQKPSESKPAFSPNVAAPSPPPPSMSSFPNRTSSPPMNSYSASPAPDSFSNLDDCFGAFTSPSQPSQPPKAVDSDPLDMLFSSSGSGTAAAYAAASGAHDVVDDWGSFDAGFGGGDAGGGSTTELDGLPPPPAGLTSGSAKVKGMDNYKQGQFADAIKWLSWAVVLMEKSGGSNVEVLSCRASCYKEVGEYKKAIADCTKILEADEKNIAVLLQRALLYESSEKYKLGAEDLRAVLKIDPSNRLAKGTIHRLLKMVD